MVLKLNQIYLKVCTIAMSYLKLSTKLTHDISYKFLYELCIKISCPPHPDDWYVSTIVSRDTRSENDIIIGGCVYAATGYGY